MDLLIMCVWSISVAFAGVNDRIGNVDDYLESPLAALGVWIFGIVAEAILLP